LIRSSPSKKLFSKVGVSNETGAGAAGAASKSVLETVGSAGSSVEGSAISVVEGTATARAVADCWGASFGVVSFGVFSAGLATAKFPELILVFAVFREGLGVAIFPIPASLGLGSWVPDKRGVVGTSPAFTLGRLSLVLRFGNTVLFGFTKGVLRGFKRSFVGVFVAVFRIGRSFWVLRVDCFCFVAFLLPDFRICTALSAGCFCFGAFLLPGFRLCTFGCSGRATVTCFRFEGTGLGGAGIAEACCFAEGVFFECFDLMGEFGCGLSVGCTGADGVGDVLGADKFKGARAAASPVFG